MDSKMNQMKIAILTLAISMSITSLTAQNVLTPEKLWELGRVSPLGISKDGKNILYKVSTPSVTENKSNSKTYSIPINGGNPTEVTETKELLTDKNISPDGKYLLAHKEVKIEKIHGKDFYPELDKSDVQVYNGLNYRHWDSWNEGKHNHVGFS
jgi:dipeptidyl aminopeptidase/acylaminoacyl peptidase